MYIKQLIVEPTHDGYRGQAEITTGAYSLTVDIAQSDNVENCRFRVWGARTRADYNGFFRRFIA